MNDTIDIYCERLDAGLWAEPMNAVTNAAFFIAALCAYLLAKKENALNGRVVLLILFILIIGTGSTLFHTFATGWAQLSDVLPILFYQIAFIVFYANRVIGLNALKTALLFALFIVTIIGFAQLPEAWLNGSLGYAPALLFVIGLGSWHIGHAGRERYGLITAGGVFTVSLALRSIDMQICESFPIGTHFLWHILNGCVLYLTTRAYILNISPSKR